MTKTDTATLRQADNKIEVEGLLLEVDSREGKTADGREFMSARLTIETVEDSEQHQVEMFSMKLKKDGTENGIYNSLKTVAEEYKSVKDVGREEADKVRTTTGEIRLNDYVNDRGLQSFPQISATFINRVEAGQEFNPHAKFETEVVVDRVVEEMDKDQEETGRAILHGYIPLYGGRVIPFEFKVGEDGTGYVMDNYEKGDTVFVYGEIINQTEKVVTKVESAFGADKENVKYYTIREFVITGGTEPYEEENANTYNLDSIAKALNEREAYLEELKKNHESNKDKKSGRRGGFDTAPKKNRTVEKDDLPF